MKGTTTAALALAMLLSAASVQAAEALVGRWVLVGQQVDGRKTPADELMLRVHPVGQTLEFAYSVPVNNIQFVSLHFAGRVDGTQTDVIDGRGKKIGTVSVTKAGNLQYKILLQGTNKPAAAGMMTISADGKTLTSESESKPAGRAAAVHMVQTFSRR